MPAGARGKEKQALYAMHGMLVKAGLPSVKSRGQHAEELEVTGGVWVVLHVRLCSRNLAAYHVAVTFRGPLQGNGVRLEVDNPAVRVCSAHGGAAGGGGGAGAQEGAARAGRRRRGTPFQLRLCEGPAAAADGGGGRWVTDAVGNMTSGCVVATVLVFEDEKACCGSC